MKLFMNCVVMLMMIVVSSVASAQQLEPVPDPGPGPTAGMVPPPGTSTWCLQILGEIVALQDEYDEIDAQIDNLVTMVRYRENVVIPAIQNSMFLTPDEKADQIDVVLQEIWALNNTIAQKEARLLEIQQEINDLWDEWYALGCHTFG
jgi:hypothetical protein